MKTIANVSKVFRYTIVQQVCAHYFLLLLKCKLHSDTPKVEAKALDLVSRLAATIQGMPRRKQTTEQEDKQKASLYPIYLHNGNILGKRNRKEAKNEIEKYRKLRFIRECSMFHPPHPKTKKKFQDIYKIQTRCHDSKIYTHSPYQQGKSN